MNIGYFAQNQEEVLSPNKTVLEEAEDAATEETRPRVRDLLGSFLFQEKMYRRKQKFFPEVRETVWLFVNYYYVHSTH